MTPTASVKKFFPIFLTFLVSISANRFFMPTACEPIPTWMRPGAQLEYMGKISEIIFYDKSMIPELLLGISKEVTDNDLGIVFLFLKEDADVYLTIHVEDVNSSHCFLKVTLKIGLYSSTKDLLVELSTRRVTMLDGAPLGQTTIWIPPCKVEDRIPIVGEENSTVLAEVYELDSWNTVQGLQDVLTLFLDVGDLHEVSFYSGMMLTPLEAQSIEHFHSRVNRYDADTFIMIEGTIDEDALLSAFNIVSFLMERFRLVSANIDLGPQNLFVALLRLLPHVILITTILVAIVFLVFIKKKGGRPQ
jgi:hypothetical protein